MKRQARLAALGALALLLGCATPQPRPDPRRSGFDFMGVEIQAMQRDDSANPAMLWVQEGQVLWNTPQGRAGKSCAGCHAAAESSMRGVAARYPAWEAALSRPVNLGSRINLCRERQQQLPPLAADNQQMLSLEAYVAHQSRGLPIAPDPDPRLEPFRARGAQLFAQRMGQLDLSCAQCHDQLAGRKLAGSVIPQGHPTGYPLYRLEWQGIGSLQRRLRGCMTGVRAEPFAAGSVEFVELELHLASRAMGMLLETPAVRP
ncbi:MAG: soxA [Ramlibacter sp.]|nr:soxA [Ramlibacter sp.]